MTRNLVLTVWVTAMLAGAQTAPKSTTVTGWFACDKCGPARLTAEQLGPSNPVSACAVTSPNRSPSRARVTSGPARRTAEQLGPSNPVRSRKCIDNGAQCARPRKKAAN